MKFFDGLHSYEIVMLALGVMLFMALLFALVFFVIKGRELKGLFAFFIVPILMIGFPGINKIQFEKLLVELERETEALEKRPDDQALKAEVEEKVKAVTARPIEGAPQLLVKVARAQKALGEENKALGTIQQALKVNPNQTKAVQLKEEIKEQQKTSQQVNEIENKTNQLARDPNNPALRADVLRNLEKIDVSRINKTQDLIKVARAQKEVGEQNKAGATVERALTLNPNSKEAANLKTTIINQQKFKVVQPPAVRPGIK
jgi:tetratricopeptide (TPR) repeat protein